ncbi:YDR061W-like protein [Saccharomyces cerevisiae x Saccharomyces kudriavzevii VIN7]|uniref:YDR061W-like protein n=1 Tax=Saccharomyces cerevisiae x Saccharomyces kudriavzevii (strain VIN7) TaxID=1095631 RepID=H0GSM5_SACCK|nr:YDR061W-like protein [Saccharomyces cerevisiae x Saccharomyces kudriavzevii VIN7]
MNSNKFVVRIADALFKPSLAKNTPPVYPQRIRHFEILPNEKWVIWGPGKSKFLNILSNKYICEPPLSLRFGFLMESSNILPRIEQVAFKGVLPTAHLSARYEYFKDDYDQTCKQFIFDKASGSNAVSYKVETNNRKINMKLYDVLIENLKLNSLQDQWVMGLSNGQMRRARLARSMLKEPDLLLIDDPFLGLDPSATATISQFLARYDNMDVNGDCPIVIGLRYQDTIPAWCTHVCCVDQQSGIVFQGSIKELQNKVDETKLIAQRELRQSRKTSFSKGDVSIDDLICVHPMFGKGDHEFIKMPHAIELDGLSVSYKGEAILENLHWKVQPGSKWHIRGDNGSGKSTLLSLLTAEHPQSWNSNVIENGVPRRTGKTNYFDINSKISMSSPELHAIFLKNAGRRLNTRESVATGYRDASSNNFLPIWKSLDKSVQSIVNMYLEYFGLDQIPDSFLFEQLTVSDQKLVLFVRSLIKMPQILILDEAFSGMEVEPMMRCHEFLEEWPGTVLVVAHVAEETPKCAHYLKLISPGEYEIGDINDN